MRRPFGGRENAVRCAHHGRIIRICRARRENPSIPANGLRRSPERSSFRFFLTVLGLAAAVICLLVDLGLWKRVTWSGYALGGIAVAYILLALPLWFRRPNPVVLLPADFAWPWDCIALHRLETGGDWFLSFAFPVTGIACLLTTTVVALARYIRRGYFFIFGGACVAVGCSAMLVELFKCITFGGQMFRWSLYPVGVLSAMGLFWILAGLIPPLGNAVRRRIFI